MNKKTLGFVALAALAALAGCAGGARLPAHLPSADAIVFADLVRIEGGVFRVGDEAIFVSPFGMAARKTTQGEWLEVMGTTPSHFRGENLPEGVDWRNLPVENITWLDAVEFANAKSLRAGLEPAYAIRGSGPNGVVTWNRGANGYRLPTELEWAFAAIEGAGPRGNLRPADEATWHAGNSGGRTREAGAFAPNALGLYDMRGNAWELAWNCFEPSGDYAEVKLGDLSAIFVAFGGCWRFPAGSWSMAWTDSFQRDSNIGVRLARSLAE